MPSRDVGLGRNMDKWSVISDDHDSRATFVSVRLQYGTVQYGTIQYGTIRRYCSVRYGTVWYCAESNNRNIHGMVQWPYWMNVLY